jgi:hypothetical protein
VTRDPFVFLVEGDPGSAEPVLPTLERGAGGKVPATIGDFSVRPGAHPRQKGEPCDRYESDAVVQQIIAGSGVPPKPGVTADI